MAGVGEAMRRPPTMTDVAQVAGVSHQTVSRVLNGLPGVRPATAERVQQAIRELGYRPNLSARLLASSRSRTIGVVT
jgi:DNA-binding LacI/PurR family transcriptional regulator